MGRYPRKRRALYGKILMEKFYLALYRPVKAVLCISLRMKKHMGRFRPSKKATAHRFSCISPLWHASRAQHNWTVDTESRASRKAHEQIPSVFVRELFCFPCPYCYVFYPRTFVVPLCKLICLAVYAALRVAQLRTQATAGLRPRPGGVSYPWGGRHRTGRARRRLRRRFCRVTQGRWWL